MIDPALEMSDWVRDCWHASGGIRAYIYSTEWEFPGIHSISRIEKADMLGLECGVI